MQLLNRIVSFSFLIIMWSCAKERTCNCTVTNSTNGFSYDYDFDGNNFIQIVDPINQTTTGGKQETKYAKIAKKSGNALCPVSSTYSENVVDTFMFNGIIVGEIYTITSKTECTLE